MSKIAFLENWYHHFNVTLGMNVYDHKFNRERGYLAAETERFRVFIIRYEDISRWNEILSKILLIDDVIIRDENVSTAKWHSRLYKEFKRTYRFSDDEALWVTRPTLFASEPTDTGA